MPTDLLPFSAFSLESSGSSAHDVGETQTLTLCTADMPLHSSYVEQMSGTIVMSSGAFDEVGPLRAAVVPCQGKPLTLTF